MANKAKKKKKTTQQPQTIPNDPWIEKRTGITLIALVSVALALFVIWQLYPVMGLESILWGIGFSAGIWGVFGLTYLFNTRMRGKR